MTDRFAAIRGRRVDVGSWAARPRRSWPSLEAESAARASNVERLIPKLAEEIERAIQALSKTLAAGDVNRARQ